ncbi:CPBP family intramembrane glutamic endopeptidase [Bacillus sp. T33-2]|uniref:CPBP family intramembrane glutamic endopeptidase n=1 Tax=Bacillus sp. T33-2 TaxID=2054168 RepID=UPI000C787FF1|nr:type II CAAX endopeptidase family protein [Bacillus sp. T33-2]PLR99781.1 CPBP family intramembrane metalloprotease [Bacillus sp. T33-2]
MKNKYKDLVKQLTDKELLFHLYATQLLLLTISAFLGMILFDSFSQFKKLIVWHDSRILIIGGSAGLLVVAADLVLMKLLPRSFYDDGGLNEKIFRDRNVFHIGAIAAIVAVSEEILFRGIIQAHFGIIISSLVFAVVHYRYLFNWFLFTNIILLSFLIGFIFMLTENLLVTVFMHFLIDFLLGISIKLKNHSERDGMLNE